MARAAGIVVAISARFARWSAIQPSHNRIPAIRSLYGLRVWNCVDSIIRPCQNPRMANNTFADNTIPNLDAMAHDDLTAFWARHQRGWKARTLFPQGGKGTQRATWDLANYAINKATAMSCRERGDIQTALMYEGIADRIYADLPDAAKW